MKVKVVLYFTTSKFAAYLILAIGTTYSFMFQDAATLLATFSAVSAILMLKTWTQSRTDQKNIENSNTPTPIEKQPDGI
jgi:hypothetical protein